MKIRKSRSLKAVAVALVLTLLVQEIAGAEAFSLLVRKSDLQPQYFSYPIDNPVLLHENYIKFTLKYILENLVADIGDNERRIFDQKLIPGIGIVFDFREQPDGIHDGKRKEGPNWVIPCAIGDIDEIREQGLYRWPYEAVVNDDKEVLFIRIAGEMRPSAARRANLKVPGEADLKEQQDRVAGEKEVPVVAGAQHEEKDQQPLSESQAAAPQESKNMVWIRDNVRVWTTGKDPEELENILNFQRTDPAFVEHDIVKHEPGKGAITSSVENGETVYTVFASEEMFLRQAVQLIEALSEKPRGETSIKIPAVIAGAAVIAAALYAAFGQFNFLALREAFFSAEEMSRAITGGGTLYFVAGAVKEVTEATKTPQAEKTSSAEQLYRLAKELEDIIAALDEATGKDRESISTLAARASEINTIYLPEVFAKAMARKKEIENAAGEKVPAPLKQIRAGYIAKLERGITEADKAAQMYQERAGRIKELLAGKRGKRDRSYSIPGNNISIIGRFLSVIGVIAASLAMLVGLMMREKQEDISDAGEPTISFTKTVSLEERETASTQEDKIATGKEDKVPETPGVTEEPRRRTEEASRFQDAREARKREEVEKGISIPGDAYEKGEATLGSVPEDATLDPGSLEAGQQVLSPGSPLAVTLIASHIEHYPPAGIPRKPHESGRKMDPCDFVHVRNISPSTINLSDYSISESKGRKRNIREFSEGRDIYLRSGEEIRIVWNGSRMLAGDLDLFRGTVTIIPEGLSKDGDTVMLYDPEGRIIAAAKSGPQEQDDITVFRAEQGQISVIADRETTRADQLDQRHVSHYLSDFSDPGIPDHDAPVRPGTDMEPREKGTGELDAVPSEMPASPARPVRSLPNMVQELLKDGYEIKLAEERAKISGLRRRLAGAGTFFWDIMLRYGAEDRGTGANSMESAITDSREDALRLGDDGRRVRRRIESLENDKQQLERAQERAERRREQLTEQQEKLEIELAREEPREDRVEEREEKIDTRSEQLQDQLDRIAREEAEIAEGIASLEEALERERNTEERLEANLDRLRRLREPELRLRSTLGAVIFDPEAGREIEAVGALERKSRVSLELTKIELAGELTRLYRDVITLNNEVHILERHLGILESLRERAVSASLTAEEASMLEMSVAKAKSDLLSKQKEYLEEKAELQFVMGWDREDEFDLEDREFSPEELRKIMDTTGADMGLYFSFLLAEKSEEIDAYSALVPSGIFKYLGVSVEAVWQEDIMRRTLYEGLRSPSFIGLRSGAVFGDGADAQRRKEAVISYLRAVEEYRLLERTLFTSRERARSAFETFKRGSDRKQAIAEKARGELDQIKTRHEQGLEDMISVLRAVDEAARAELDREYSEQALAAAALDMIRFQGTVRMDLSEHDDDTLRNIKRLIDRYRRHFRREDKRDPDGKFSRITAYLPNLGSFNPVNFYRSYLRGAYLKTPRQSGARCRHIYPGL